MTLVTACLGHVGKCRPGETTRWTATIAKVEFLDDGGVMLRTRRGHDVVVMPDVVQRCHPKGGLEEGRRVIVASMSNGPCPPSELVLDCP